MIEQNGNELRITAPMLIANASALLEAGRGFLRGGVGAGGVVVGRCWGGANPA